MMEIAIPIIDNRTSTDDKIGVSLFEKSFIQEPADNIDDCSCGGKDTTL
jgi:hypothetical protein